MKFEINKNHIKIGDISNSNSGVIMSRSDEVSVGIFQEEKFIAGFNRSVVEEIKSIGRFNEDNLHSLRFIVNESKTYLGQVLNNKYDGIGELISGKEKYTGQFKEGLKNGLFRIEGYEYCNYNEIDIFIILYGYFKNDKKEGVFFKKSSGYLTLEYYENDILIDFHINMASYHELNIKSWENKLKQLNEFERFIGGDEFGYSKSSDIDNIYFGALVDNELNGFGYHYSWKSRKFIFGHFINGKINTCIITEQIDKSNWDTYSIIYKSNFNNSFCEIIDEGDKYKSANDGVDIYEFNNNSYNTNLKCELGQGKIFYSDSCLNFIEYNDELNNIKYEFIGYDFLNEEINGNSKVIELKKLFDLELYNNPASIINLDKRNPFNDDYVEVSYIDILKKYNNNINCLEPYYLIIDTETNGLPNKSLSDGNIFKWPRLIQIAYLQFSQCGTLLRKYETLISPIGFEIMSNHISGISQIEAIEKGVDLSDYLNDFAQIINESKVIVGHNINFDINVLISEYKRLGIDNTINEKKLYCTMLNYNNHFPQEKYLKLEELYHNLFGRKYKHAHSAIADVNATSLCFWKMIEFGYI
jgi:DNA polymerase III epsilon subunit-like protein